MAKISIRVIPNASKTEVAGKEGATWKIRLAAPPVDGKANGALIKFLSDVLDIPKSSIEVLKGHSSKQKIVEIPMNIGDIEERLT
ncbi:DUF167 domain-containing protein [Candidatus Uhrbacteria bacterium]|nr:DUF167 domain-containing protein [Candidatus Uhrbacteria bacterium]